MEKNKREFSLNAKNLASANLGQKIRFYRQIAGMTQKELGTACDVNESTIRNYELGNRYPDSDTIFEISNDTFSHSVPNSTLISLFVLLNCPLLRMFFYHPPGLYH